MSDRPDQAHANGFQLDGQLLSDYPEMAAASSSIEEGTQETMMNVSQIYINSNTVDHFIVDVLADKPTGSIEYLLRMVEDGLTRLAGSAKPEYTNFINAERAKLEERKLRAQEAIGDKKRNPGVENGRYV